MFSRALAGTAITLFSCFDALAGVLIDDAQGMYPSDVIYSDMDVAQLEAIPETQPHRIVDLDIVKADEQGARKFISKSLMLKKR